MIKYIGSKRVLLPAILRAIERMDSIHTVIDLFSGTSRVGHALKAKGYRVFANDHNAYAATIARCYVEADAEDVASDAARLVGQLNRLPGKAGYFTETFCIKSRFFQPKNGARVDAIRAELARLSLPPELEAVMLVSLMEAADRVDSTTGLQMAYLKQWAPRASNDLQLRVPDVLPRTGQGKCRALQLDAYEAARTMPADLAYLDPPYNQHKYLGNYHIWESLVLGDEPEVYGIACKRVDCRTRSSAFNSRPKALAAMRRVVEALRTPNIVVSFNNEGHIARADMEALLGERGHVAVVELAHKRYVGAQIGIHNLQGEKVGEVSHLRNKEFLYLVTPEPLVIQ